MRVIDPTDLSRPCCLEIIEQWGRSPARGRMLKQFGRAVRAIRDALREGRPAPSIWRAALDATGHQPKLAMQMLGIIVGQIEGPLRHVERTLLPNHPELAPAVEGLAEAARTNYLLREVHELSRLRTGRTNLYPSGVKLQSGKFYHFYANASVTTELLGQQHSRAGALATSALVGAGYEATSLGYNLHTEPSRSPHQILRYIVDAIRDTHSHIQGGRFAIKLWQAQSASATRSVVERPAARHSANAPGLFAHLR
jgi:hypothetical protein